MLYITESKVIPKREQKRKTRGEIPIFSIYIVRLITMRESLDRGNLSCGWSGPVIASLRRMI